MSRERIQLEYLMKASPTILYEFFTEPAFLIRWFCDEVDVVEEDGQKRYIFVWSGSEEAAVLVEAEENQSVTFRWEDAEDEEEYLKFTMTKSPITGETVLEITEFCDDDEVEDQTQFWNTQIEKLRRQAGG